MSCKVVRIVSLDKLPIIRKIREPLLDVLLCSYAKPQSVYEDKVILSGFCHKALLIVQELQILNVKDYTPLLLGIGKLPNVSE